jgi:hypothetical protein
MSVFLCNYLLSSLKNSTITTRNDAPYWSAPRLLIGQLQHFLLPKGKGLRGRHGYDLNMNGPCNHIENCGIFRLMFYYSLLHRVYTEWQWPLSGEHSTVMEKLAQPGEGGGGGCTPNPFFYIYHHVQSCGVRLYRKGRYTPLISSSPLNVLCGLL